MSHFKLSSSPQAYMIPPKVRTPVVPSNVIYVRSDQPKFQYSNQNAKSHLIFSSGNQISSSPTLIPNFRSNDDPKPFFSPPQRKINPQVQEKTNDFSSDNVDDIVAKCLSRTQKLIEGIKKVKKYEDSPQASINFEGEKHSSGLKPERNVSAPHHTNDQYPKSQFSMAGSQHQTEKPEPGTTFLHLTQVIESPLKQNVILPSSPLKKSRVISSPSKVLVSSVGLRNSPSTLARNSPSPRRLVLSAQQNTPSRFATSYIFLSSIYVAHEIESYTGGISDNKPHGRGVCIYKNGFKYEGEFDNGLKHGFGILRNNNDEEVYCGDWEMGRFHGDGILLNPNYNEDRETKEIDYNDITDVQYVWRKYEGGFAEGKMHGLGTIHLKNGDKLRGKFVNGIINGEGSYYKANGETVLGFWEKGKLTLVF